MAASIDFDKIVEKVHKHVPDASVETTDERLPRWKLANRTAWMEYDPGGDLMINGTRRGGSTMTYKYRGSASKTATVIVKLLVEPVEPVELGAERPA